MRPQGRFNASRETDAVASLSFDMETLTVRRFVWDIVGWEWEKWNKFARENCEAAAVVTLAWIYDGMRKHELYTTRAETEKALRTIILMDAEGQIKEDFGSEYHSDADSENDSIRKA